MYIGKIKVQNFTVFGALELEFTKGINVLVGTNGTGKTHLLKSTYAICEGIGKDYRATYEIAQPYFLVDARNLVKNQMNQQIQSSFTVRFSKGTRAVYSVSSQQ